MAKIGFIGLGIMGKPMLRNLRKAGHELLAYDIVPVLLDAVVGDGVERAASCSEVARKTDIVITMLPDGPEVEQAVLGSNGVLEGAHQGGILVDMSSISPVVSQKIGEACAQKGVEFLDAPVSGGEPKAIDATLAIMVGGDKATFQKVAPILELLGSSVTLTGGVGAGNVTKLANQIIVACNIAAMSEALVLADRCGVDAEVVFNAIKGGLAGSTVLNAKAPMVIARNFKPGFRIRLHQKDLRNALLTAESKKVALPLTSMVQQMLIALMNQGSGDHGPRGDRDLHREHGSEVSPKGSRLIELSANPSEPSLRLRQKPKIIRSIDKGSNIMCSEARTIRAGTSHPYKFTPLGRGILFGLLAFAVAGTPMSAQDTGHVFGNEQILSAAQSLRAQLEKSKDEGTGLAEARLDEVTFVAVRVKSGRAEVHKTSDDVFVVLSRRGYPCNGRQGSQSFRRRRDSRRLHRGGYRREARKGPGHSHPPGRSSPGAPSRRRDARLHAHQDSTMRNARREGNIRPEPANAFVA